MRFPDAILAGAAVAAAVSSVPARAAPMAPAQIEAAFESAMRAIATGHARDAVPTLRTILAQDARLVRVRLELARALFQSGQMKAAKAEFMIVLSGQLPAPVRAKVLRFVSAIDQRQGISSSLEFSLAAPSGATRHYKTNSVMLDLFGGVPLPFTLNRADPPRTGVQIKAAARRQWRLDGAVGGHATFAYLRGQARLLDAPNSPWDEAEVTVAPGLRLVWPRAMVSLEQRTKGTYLGHDLLERRLGLALDAQHRAPLGTTVFASLAADRVSNMQVPQAGGPDTKATLGVQKTFGGTSSLTAAVTLDRMRADRADYSYRDTLFWLGGHTEARGGISLDATLYAEVNRKDAATPGFLVRRKDRTYGLDVTLRKTDLFVMKWYTPFVTFGLARDFSTVAAYSYTDPHIQVGLTKAF